MKLLCLLPFLLAATAAGATELVVTDLRLLDPVNQTVRAASLHLLDGKIVAVGTADGSEWDAALPRWAGSGRFATRGFVDVSTVSSVQVSPGHRDALTAESARMLFLAAGVHRIMDLQAGRATAFAAAAGPALVAPGGVGAELPGAIGLANPQAARAAVGDLIKENPARISVFMDRGRNRRGLDAATLAAVLEAAGTVPVAVYVGTWRDVHDALAAGARWIVQIPTGPVPPPVLEQVQSLRPMWTPALAVGTDFMALMSVDSLRTAPALVRALPEAMRADYGQVRVQQARLSAARVEQDDRLRTLVALHAAGATLTAGSQSGGLGTAHGWSLLRELQWWSRAGIDGWTILAAATQEGAGAEGFVAGAVADFNLYAASPVDRASGYFEPEVVFVAGEPRFPDGLAARASHRLTEDIPANPLPGGNRWSLLLISVGGFGLLLFLRRLVKRAATRALDS